jgi:enoyl-CoA hydratase/carnithine racemase
METTELIANGSEPGIVQLILSRPAQPNAWMPSHQTAFVAALDDAAANPEHDNCEQATSPFAG